MHAKPFRLHAPGHKARHARPESPLHPRGACGEPVPGLHLPAGHGHGIPASAATGSNSMSSLQNKLNKLSQSIKLHEQELNNAKRKKLPPRRWKAN